TTAPSVTEVSGVVTDSTTGSALAGATVAMQDGANNPRQTGTDSTGHFKFTSSANSPIAPGTLSLGATKDGYQTPTAFVTQQGIAGKGVDNVRIKLKPAGASASAGAPTADSAFGSQQAPPPVLSDTANNQAVDNTSAAKGSGSG